LAKGWNLKNICDGLECRRRYNRERQKKYRSKDKQINKGDKGEETIKV